MSIIVYGPQGCGKSRNAERLRRHFKMARVVDAAANPYPETEGDMSRFKAGDVLFITNEPPPKTLTRERRIMSYEAAIVAAPNSD